MTDLDLAGRPRAGSVLDRIRKTSRDQAEKGRWFEQLFMRVARQEPEFEIEDIHRWPDWPEREELTGLSGEDTGIDLVARRTSGEWIAIQCKCYDKKRRVNKEDIDSFLGRSGHKLFDLRWIVATCDWGRKAESAIRNMNPEVRQIDFREYLDVRVEERDAKRPVQAPWPLQEEAIENVVRGLGNHDRGRLVMACGTGKTFTSLRIAEQVVEDGGRILFVAPTIALVSQARREWLRQTTRRLHGVVVCSDATAGGRQENTEDIRTTELECPVTTKPAEIAKKLLEGEDTRVVFCTYHSLRRVTEAQAKHGAPAFDLAIADEAHRTTGLERKIPSGEEDRKVDFQEFHDDERLSAQKRLYMTATPRIYTETSKRKLGRLGIDVVDMGDFKVYGPEMHRLSFKKAVRKRILSDYRVIVLGVGRGSVTSALRRRLERLVDKEAKNAPTTNEMTRVLGVSLAINGFTRGKALERPGRLPRTMMFANNIARSKWYADALMDRQVRGTTTRRLEDGAAMKVDARHLDASASALQRNQALRRLASADERTCRVVSNVKLFTEGVDVPSLDAVAFLDPRDSQVDVVQAVGRVMRKAPGKRFGYIIVPVVVPPGSDVVAALEWGSEGYQTVGRVLRALQAHDGRLAEDTATFVQVYETDPVPKPNGEETDIQPKLDLREAETGIFAHIGAAAGLGKPGQVVASEIIQAVQDASAIFAEEALEGPLAQALDLTPEDDGGAKGVCTIAALMLANACLLQRRLRDEPGMEMITSLDAVSGSSHPIAALEAAWKTILETDYEKVFEPALDVLGALPEGRGIEDAVRIVVECANRVADSLSELGLDYAGPLYHRILGSAKSDGAFYTNNISAILLARLAFPRDFADWSDPKAVAKLRILDPACGTGTLLMAALRTLKDRVAEARELSDEDQRALHRELVEETLCGLDINAYGLQLAACNMILGAPTVKYGRLNLVAAPHGPQKKGPPRAGSLDILDQEQPPRLFVTDPPPEFETVAGDKKKVEFPLHDLDAVIMNAPFTANKNRSLKYGEAGRRAMQEHELGIQRRLGERDPEAARCVTANSIGTFFTPLAEKLVRKDSGALAKVIPTTACTNASGKPERQFLAERFHVETVVTSHDPGRIHFSENTAIHESLLVCRRRRPEFGGGGGG